MGYAPKGLPVGDLKVDVLIADAGVGSMNFPDNWSDDPMVPEGSLIRRFMHVLDAHQGLVIYMHNDPSLPFYFRQLAGRRYGWGHKQNGYTNPIAANRGEKWVRDSGWGNFSEVFDNKKSVVLTRALPKHFEYMIDNFDTDRAGYREYSPFLNFEYVPPAYDYSLCNYEYSKIDLPLFYSGGDRRRRIAFRRFYEEMGVPTYVSGKWDEDTMESFDGINFMGWLEDRKALLDTINKAGCVVQIQPKDAARLGWWTARTMEVPACKSMCFIDGSIQQASDLVFDKWFVLKDKEDARRKIKTFLNLRMKDRIKIIELQNSYCKTLFTWKRFADVFMSICKKYMDDPMVVTRTVRKEYKNSLDILLKDNQFNIEYPDLPEYEEKIIAPGHTDLMVAPEKIDEYLEKHPPNNEIKLPFEDVPMEVFL